VRKFLFKILFFLVSILFFILGYEILLRKSYTPNIYSFKNKLLEEEYEGIVLGNSHALRDIIAENLEFTTINLSNVSQSITIDQVWLEEAIELNTPKFIILNVSIPTLTGDLFESKENWRIKNYNIYTRLQLSFKAKYNFEFLNGSQIENFNRVYNFIIGSKIVDTNYLNKGSYPLNEMSKNLESDAFKAAKRHCDNIENMSENKNTLREIIQISKSNHFNIFIVTPPAHKLYRDLIPDNIKTELYSFLSELELNHDNVYWLNYFESNKFRNDMYKDSDHLNFNGALLLTKKIDYHLKEHSTNQNL
jgi:hypothetical protein